MQEQQKEIAAKHTFMTGYFNLPPTDELNDKSEEFFKIFQSLFKQIEQALPKIEKKRSGVPSKSQQVNQQAAMMAEMKALQAK